MIRKDLSLASRFVGVSLFIIGLALILFLPDTIVNGGLFVQLAYIWVMTICIGIGSLLLVGLSSNRIVRAFLIVFALGLPWSILLFLPLPIEFRLWPAVVIALFAVLVYRYYYKKRNFPKPTLSDNLRHLFILLILISKPMISFLLSLFTPLTIVGLFLILARTQSLDNNRIRNWKIIIDLLYKAGYAPQSISKILDYYAE